MNTELYIIQVTFDATVDNLPWQRTYHIMTAKGTVEAVSVALERLRVCVTADPERKITKMVITKIHKDNFILSDIKEQHTDGR